jgi:hypothetical protein
VEAEDQAPAPLSEAVPKDSRRSFALALLYHNRLGSAQVHT